MNLQAKDIPDFVFLGVIASEQTRRGSWAHSWDVAALLNVDVKLARAKARALIQRGLMTGCDAQHNCRGDWERP